MEKKESIEIIEAREHNLKNISVKIPLNKLTCVTGVSGCGKSSLVYDTIFAESQRNMLEGLSGNLFGQKLMDKPDVKEIKNLRPALDISQNYYNRNPRSTVGTITDISNYLRSLFTVIINHTKAENLSESFFSSNNPIAFCTVCKGTGEQYYVSERLVIPDETKSLSQGAILPYKGKDNSYEYKLLVAIAKRHNIDLEKPFCDLSDQEKNILLYAENTEEYNIRYRTAKGRYKQKKVERKGIIIELKEQLENIETPSVFLSISKYLRKGICSRCHGLKLNEKILSYKVNNLNISEVENLSIIHLIDWLKKTKQEFGKFPISKTVDELIDEMISRADKINQLRIEYLSLSRSVTTLSGGEIQRVRLASQLSCSLKGLLYIFDEPCKGLHYRDIQSIINATHTLVDEGNTVIAIEHNKQYIRSADQVLRLGPVGGPEGGYVISETNRELKKLKKDQHVQKIFKHRITINGISIHNIHNQSISFPVGGITCITGVSGSGKSSLLEAISTAKIKNSEYFKSINGISYISKIISVDQKSIGKTSRSTCISYLDIYDDIRKLLVQTKKAAEANLQPSDFSINVKGGRCECCQGTGLKRIELKYLPDTYIRCPECNGKRFNEKVLSVKYKGLNITEILDSTVDQLLSVFSEQESIYNKLLCMNKMGLGYIKLGQMSMSLSGGEAQRIKLAKALGKRNTKALFLLDEPTSGIDSEDIEKLIDVLEEISRMGNTIVMIEHNLEFANYISDYIIDFGIYAGEKGGNIVACGTSDEIQKNSCSSWYDIKF